SLLANDLFNRAYMKTAPARKAGSKDGSATRSGRPRSLQEGWGMKLSTRLAIAMVALVLFTATAVVLFTYRNLEAAILPQALERLATHAALRATELEAQVVNAGTDVLALRSAASIEGLASAHVSGGIHPIDGTSEQTWRARTARRLAGLLESK